MAIPPSTKLLGILAINVMKIEINDEKKGQLIFSGKYEFVEAGLEEGGRPSFHINTVSEQKILNIYFNFDDIMELKEFINNIKMHIL